VPARNALSAAAAAARVDLIGVRTVDSLPPVATPAPDAAREEPVVARRDDVDRAAYETGLNDAAPLERATERVALEGLDT
jgi:hypothetical protein